MLDSAIVRLRHALDQRKEWGTLSTHPRPFPANLQEHRCEALVEWYTEAAPTGVSCPWVVERLELYEPIDVWGRQEGFRFSVGRPDRISRGWQPEWLVVGDAATDPIIIDCTTSVGAVLMAVHGSGSWTPQVISDDLGGILMALGHWLELWLRLGGRIRDDDGQLLTEVTETFTRTGLAHLSDECRANRLGFLE